MRRGTLAVVLLFVLAGCGGSVTSEEPTTGTVTPAPVPEDPDRRAETLAPGLAAGGVFDAGRLAAAHADSLAGRSFTRVRTDSRLVDGEVRRRDETTLEYAGGGERFRYRLTQTDTRGGSEATSEIARYADGERVYVATTRDGRTNYSILRDAGGGVYDPRRVFPDNGTGEGPLARLLVLVSVEVTDRRTVDGQRLYRIETPGRQDIPPLRNISLVGNVTETGLVRDYRLSYGADRGGERVGVQVTVEYRDVGRTVVDPPEWLPAARAATGPAGNATAVAGATTATPSTA